MSLKLRTGGRLAAGFSAIVVVMLIVVGVAAPLIQNALRTVTTGDELRVPVAATSQKLALQTVASANALRGYIITRDPEMRVQWEQQWRLIERNAVVMEGLSARFTSAENQQAWRAISQNLPKLRAAQASVFPIADTGDQAASAEAMRTQVIPLFQQTQSQLVGERGDAGLAGRQSALLSAELKGARVKMEQTRLSVFLGLAGLVLVASVAGWVTTRSIVGPLTQLNELLRQMATGRFDLKVTGTDRADEIGDIARAAEVFRENGLARAALEAEAKEFQNNLDTRLKETEAAFEAAGQQQRLVVQAMARQLSALAQGDLTARLSEDVAAEYAELKRDFNAAITSLEATVTAVATTTSSIGASSDEMAQASDDLSRRTEQQAAGLEETAAALDEITATVKTTAEGAHHASTAVAAAKAEAQRSGEVVDQAVQAMGEIEDSSRQISQIIGVIDEIAFQTNLLALNAGVEAARAGDAGRGFAVVASEVRALAQRSAEAAKEIKTLISASSQQVGQGVSLVGETGKALQSIVAKVAEIDTVISTISASAQEQAIGLAQVNVAVNQMDQVVQQNAAMVEQATAATHSMKGETRELIQLIGKFQVGDAPSPGASTRGDGPRLVSDEAVARPSPARAMRQKVAANFGGGAPSSDRWEDF
ncbi:methyl-accepting chemotaxis protein [Phenylobacterium sp.]|uniref:methyl-accepting chemotaxis protein n=1 Tax=Phenylobacterium sp. TaxID=1871053 RepID=UPI0027318803|nr:methyl-accepting chemotaxis protein [Phenylobacterium sp.]MDP1875300.1 methyl-accepting chemotaxis protein [Phenylobacterium sp.]